MKQKIDSLESRRMYSRRIWTIEPFFGNITSNKGLSRIGVRGEVKATAQWLMYCMMHNIELPEPLGTHIKNDLSSCLIV
jgi:hypothetical protein